MRHEGWRGAAAPRVWGPLPPISGQDGWVQWAVAVAGEKRSKRGVSNEVKHNVGYGTVFRSQREIEEEFVDVVGTWGNGTVFRSHQMRV